MTETELMSKYSTRKSFYHKATIIEDDPRDPNSILLKSYGSIVAKVDQDGQKLIKTVISLLAVFTQPLLLAIKRNLLSNLPMTTMTRNH